MPFVKVIVRWRGEKYDIEIDPEEPLELFKSQIYTLTGVAPDRQKILNKGTVLKDDTDLETLNIQEGQAFMMIGSVGELPNEPHEKIVFLEDMTDKQKAEALKLPTGLKNLGNTCYLNSTLQCLRAIPELQESLNKSKITTGDQVDQSIALSLGDLYKQLNQTTEGYPPLNFLKILRTAYPQFAQRDNYGYMQQDAEECWSQIVSSLSNTDLSLSSSQKLVEEGSSTSSSNSNTQSSFIKQYMTGEYTSVLKCTEAPDEEPVVLHEPFNRINCHISASINYVMDGIVEALDEHLMKNSPTLNRQAKYHKKSRISRLPSYLTVHFVRFFWKSTQQRRTKILRIIKFPFEFDATELCTDELKKKILPVKERLIELEKKRDETKKKGKLTKNPDQNEMEDIKKEDDLSVEEIKKTIDPDLAKDAGFNVTGLYDLCAVLTHTGRNVDAGHYIAWVRKEDNSDDWIKYDDDRVSIVTPEDIQKLDGSGGADWHIAYMLLYKSKKIE